MDIEKVLITITVIGLFVTGLGLFIAPFVDTYGIAEPSIDKYNYLDNMIQDANKTENTLKGLDTLQNNETSGLKKFVSLGDFVLSSAFNVFIQGLSSISFISSIFYSLGIDLEIPAAILMGVSSIIIILVMFGIAKLFLSVIKK